MPAADAQTTISDAELVRLFERCASLDRVALAVSGGADSLALLILACRWRQLTGSSTTLHVLTVDHGLRAESAAEADFVLATAARYGVEARAMRWDGPYPSANIEAVAREARYRLLTGAAREIGCSVVATAHHREDQAETLLLRLARGSGVYGLAAMATERDQEGVTLFRPLLGLPRATLRGVVEAEGLRPVLDPHNDDPRFDRVRMRQLMPQMESVGLDAATLAATANRLRRAAAAIDVFVGRLFRDFAVADDLGGVRLDAAALAAEPEEVRLRAVGRILRAAGGAPYMPRLDTVEALERAMQGADFARHTAAGVLIDLRRGQFRFQREAGRQGLPSQRFERCYDQVWDGRFRISASHLDGAPIDIGPLGAMGRRILAVCVPKGMPQAIESLPALRLEGRLIAVPSLLPQLAETFDGIAPAPAGLAVTITPLVASRLMNPSL